jgi:hypothetical protein
MHPRRVRETSRWIITTFVLPQIVNKAPIATILTAVLHLSTTLTNFLDMIIAIIFLMRPWRDTGVAQDTRLYCCSSSFHDLLHAFSYTFRSGFFLLLPLLFSPGERILLYEIMEMLSIAFTHILA